MRGESTAMMPTASTAEKEEASPESPHATRATRRWKGRRKDSMGGLDVDLAFLEGNAPVFHAYPPPDSSLCRNTGGKGSPSMPEEPSGEDFATLMEIRGEGCGVGRESLADDDGWVEAVVTREAAIPGSGIFSTPLHRAWARTKSPVGWLGFG